MLWKIDAFGHTWNFCLHEIQKLAQRNMEKFFSNYGHIAMVERRGKTLLSIRGDFDQT